MRILIFCLCLFLPLHGWALKVGLLLRDSSPEKEKFLRLTAELTSRFRLEGLSYYFSTYDSRRPFKAVRQAKSEGVAVLIGPFNPGDNEKAVEAARAYGIPIILLTGDLDPLRMPDEPFRGVFRTGLSPRLAAKGILRCLAKKGFQRIGLLLSLDQYGYTGVKWLKVYAWEYRLRISKTVWFGPRDTMLFNKLEELLPMEAVVVWCGRESALKVVREMNRYGLKIPVIFGPEIADEEFLRSHPELYGYPFPATALYLSSQRRALEIQSLSLKISALVDALFLIKHLIAIRAYPTEKAFEELGKIELPGGTYYLSSDDHYGLLPQSVGLFIYDLGGFRPYCAPRSL